MTGNPNEEAIKKLIYNDRKAFVERKWEQYLKTTNVNGDAGDYRLLAEICLELPFFEHPEVGEEICRILIKTNPKKKQDYQKVLKHQRQKDQILRIWDDWKSGDQSETYDNVEVRRFISKQVGGIWTEDKVRDVIRERDKALGKTD